jgi:alanine-alpha-ketoisovalerate/valine-pyruvate aminotransferase
MATGFVSRCGDCPFFDTEVVSKPTAEKGNGVCRVEAPANREPRWPMVHAGDYCGKHPNIVISVQRVMTHAQMEHMMELQNLGSPKSSSGLVVPNVAPAGPIK